MNAVELLTAQIKQAHGVVTGTVSDLTPEQAIWSPGGEANPIGAELLHLLAAEDMFLTMMTSRQPVAMGAFARQDRRQRAPSDGRLRRLGQARNRRTCRRCGSTWRRCSRTPRSTSLP